MTTDAIQQAAPPPVPDHAPRIRFGLSGRLLGLTLIFVLLAEVLIYVPTIANFYERWLANRLGRARTVALVIDAAPSGMPLEELTRQLLADANAHLIVLKTDDTRRLLAISDPPGEITREIDLRETRWFTAIRDSLATLIFGANGVLRVVGHAPSGGEFVEMVMAENALRDALLSYSQRVLWVSLLISLMSAVLVYLTLDRLIVRPVRRLTDRMVAFGRNPETMAPLVPSGRRDELGLAERELGRMEVEIQNALAGRARLAGLGLAVSKINHELRNMLSAAQLVSERLEGSSDPSVRRLGAKLMATLERALVYCRSTLAYGRAQEPAPKRRPTPLATLVHDVRDALGLTDDARIGWVESIERGLTVDGDPDQLFRVLLNLGRNSLQAMEARGPTDPARDQIWIAGRREGAVVEIEMSDTGPGVSRRAREHLFAAFQGSTRPGGTGLGLPIAAELVRAHAGEIRLVEGTIGATFRVTIPDRPVDLRAARTRRASA